MGISVHLNGNHSANLLDAAGGDLAVLNFLIERIREEHPWRVRIKPEHIEKAKDEFSDHLEGIQA